MQNLNLLPFFLRRHIENRPNLIKIIFNTGWLTVERIFRLGFGLAVSIIVARHLGPEQLGILSYALSIVAFMSIFIYLGLSGLVVREIVRFSDEKEMLLGTTFSLKLTGSVLAFIAVLCLAFFTSDPGDSEFLVLLIVGLSLFASPFETIDYWFQSQLQSKYSVLAKSTAFISAAFLKVIFVLMGASVVAFAVASSIEILLASVCLIYIYQYKGFSILKWKASLSKAKELLGQSWIIILSGFLAMVNLKVDQIMLRWISGAAEVGIYSIAVTFSEVWYFIPTIIAMSVFPRLIELKRTQYEIYDKRLQQIFDVLFTMAFMVAIVMTIIAGPLIPFLYTDSYAGSASILVIHIWGGVFMFMRALFSKWVFIEDALFFSLISHGLGAVVNVVLNFILIPKFGGKGAAISTLVSYAASSYFFLFLYSKTRPLAVKMSKSFVLPIRLIIFRRNLWA
jgi:O-antigen/teichoic acid export membrane protein